MCTLLAPPVTVMLFPVAPLAPATLRVRVHALASTGVANKIPTSSDIFLKKPPSFCYGLVPEGAR